MLNEIDRKVSKGECRWRRREWNDEWDKKERPAKENVGEGSGNGMLIERKKEQQRKKNAGEGGGNGLLNEREGKASKGECWQGRGEWNAEWERRKGQQRRMLVSAKWMECWMK
jgi:hypothetical protein